MGQKEDIAFFYDFMSLAQHGETGDPTNPRRGASRTAIEEASFIRGLMLVNPRVALVKPPQGCINKSLMIFKCQVY